MTFARDFCYVQTDKQNRYNVIQIVSMVLENLPIILVTQSPHDCTFAALKIHWDSEYCQN